MCLCVSLAHHPEFQYWQQICSFTCFVTMLVFTGGDAVMPLRINRKSEASSGWTASGRRTKRRCFGDEARLRWFGRDWRRGGERQCGRMLRLELAGDQGEQMQEDRRGSWMDGVEEDHGTRWCWRMGVRWRQMIGCGQCAKRSRRKTLDSGCKFSMNE